MKQGSKKSREKGIEHSIKDKDISLNDETNQTDQEISENEEVRLEKKHTFQSVMITKDPSEKNADTQPMKTEEEQFTETEGEQFTETEGEEHIKTEEKRFTQTEEEQPTETEEEQPIEAEEQPIEAEEAQSGEKEKSAAKENETEEIIEVGAEEQEAEKEKSKSGKKKKILIPMGILVVLAGICGCIYSVMAFSYKEKFLPGTWINGVDCTEMDGAQVAGILENQLQTYRLDVKGRDYTSGAAGVLLGQITAKDISLTYSGNSREMVDTLLEKQDVFTWLYRKMSDTTYSFDLFQGVTYDREKLKGVVKGWEALQSDNMSAARDAYIGGYSEELKGYEIVPEVEGTELYIPTVLELIDVAILSQETLLDLEAEGCYEEPEIRRDDAELTEAVETVNKWLGTKIVYDWNGTEVVVDAELLKDWITMEKDGPVLDEKAVAAFVKEQAEINDTYGKRRNFVTTLGVELSLRSGYYGWQTDKETETEELIEAIYQGKTQAREPVYSNTARQKGTNDIGDSYVEVDLTHQHLYLYEDGAIIFESDFVSGSMSSTPDCVTPEGVFGLSYKTTNAVLRGANYETPVNYWMPFYGNYGLHDATWRAEFGGQIYITNGSHGCVNLPLGSAATIYDHVSTGFPVICYYYQVDPLAVQPPAEEGNNDDGNNDGVEE